MSDSDETDEDIPEVSECQRLCEEFAEVTGTDTACAQFYLQDRKWNLERSTNDFFEDIANKGALRINDKKEAEVVVVLDGSKDGLAAAATAVLAESALSSRTRALPQAVVSEPPKEEQTVLKFISWNIDGLDEKNLKLRTKAVCRTILQEQADIVFLQELLPETAQYFLINLTGYECFFGNEVGYFTGTFLKLSSVKCQDFTIVDFPCTRMMRNVLQINAVFGDVPLCLLNTHLESTRDGAEERKKQLKAVFKDILKRPDEKTVIFAGDLNLRDEELTGLGGLPTGIEDVWTMCGSRKELCYTFDMQRNDNLIFNGRYKPRCRFDRVYLHSSSPSKLKPIYFGLIGLERLIPHRCFPSDHWGILCHFELES